LVGKDRGRVSAERLEHVMKRGGKLEMAEALRCRVRYFTDGMALGSAEFLKQLQSDHEDWFPDQRKAGSARMKGADWGELRVIRNLRVSPLA